MIDLSTNYMGLRLSNPIVVASSGLTNKVKGIQRCADAGAGAVVIKSLFEEQIRGEAGGSGTSSWVSDHPEAMAYVENMSMLLGPRKYLDLIKEAKDAVSIPVIASLNCASNEWWMDYAAQISKSGADALELNISVMPNDISGSGRIIENGYFTILKEVKARVDIPIAVKIDPYFTCVARMAGELSERGAAALVLFNRYYQFDIDIDKLKLTSGNQFSSPEEISTSLRWMALLYGRLDCDLAAATGIHDGIGVIKQLLAGATVTQLCSTLYINGLGQIGKILEYVEKWMDDKGFDSVDQMRGKMSQQGSERPELYERLQYIKARSGSF